MALRAALLLFYLNTHGWRGETWEYEVIARNLMEGRGYIYVMDGCALRSFVVPVFPLVCAALHWIWGPGLGLFYVFHLAVSMGVVYMTWTLTRQWLGERTALGAAMLSAVEPVMIVYQSYKVDVNALALLFLLAGLCFFARLREAPGTRPAAVTGIFMGLGMLTRPDVIVALSAPVAGFFIDRDRQRMRKAVPLILLAAAATLSPWWVRNYWVHRRWIPFTTASPMLFWEGNNPLNPSGTLMTSTGQTMLDVMPDDIRRRLSACDELQRMAVFRDEAMRCIRADPGAFLKRLGRKFVNFWWFSPTFATMYYSWVRNWMVAWYKVFHLLMLGLAALGLFHALWRDGEDARRLSVCLMAVVLAQAFIHTAFYVETRHRLLIMPLLLALASRGGVVLWDRIRKLLAAGAIAAVVAFAATNPACVLDARTFWGDLRRVADWSLRAA